VARGAGRLDPGWDFAPLAHDPARDVFREARGLLRDRVPLRLVGAEESRRGPALQHGGDLPGEIGGGGEARVHAVAGVRYPQVRRAPADECPPVAEAVGDESAADPVFLRDDLVGEVRTDAQYRTYRPVAVHRVEIRFPAVEPVVDDPGAAAV